ncbi:hypothetical protein CsSME_00009385 [Camellia sinensis var. sinensis]
MVGDRPLVAGDSALESVEVGAALSSVVLLPADINRMAELIKYENYTLIMQHYVLAIQQGHSFIVKAEKFKKNLTKKTKETATLLSLLNQAEARIQGLLDQAKATQLAQSKAEDRAEVVENVTEVTQAEAKEVKEKEAQA